MEIREEKKDHNEVRNEEGEGENRTEATFGFAIVKTPKFLKNLKFSKYR